MQQNVNISKYNICVTTNNIFNMYVLMYIYIHYNMYHEYNILNEM